MIVNLKDLEPVEPGRFSAATTVVGTNNLLSEKEMNNTHSHRVSGNQCGFFSVGVGLGLTALFSLFGVALQPDHQTGEIDTEQVLQKQVNAPENVFVASATDAGRHQF